MKLTQKQYDLLQEIANKGSEGGRLSWSLWREDVIRAFIKCGYVQRTETTLRDSITGEGLDVIAAGRPSDMADAVRSADPRVVKAAFNAGWRASSPTRISRPTRDFVRWLDSLT